MGKESIAQVSYRGKNYEAKVLLESAELIVRGELPVKVPLASVSALRADAGVLRLEIGQEMLELTLGEKAASWERAIREPRGLLDKLGVKAGQRVAVVGSSDDGLEAQLRERTGAALADGGELDLLFLRVGEPEQLMALGEHVGRLKQQGALWVLYPRRRPELGEAQVREVARASGLVDVKIAGYSEREGAVKLMIPRARRTR